MVMITLAPKGSFHIGEPVGIERQAVLTHVPADTLFAAIATTWAQNGRDVNALLSRFTDTVTPPLLLTSAFPCLYDHDFQTVMRFFPRPWVKLNAGQEAIEAAGKDLKKAAWVSEQLFWQLCTGENIEAALNKQCFGPGGLWVTPEDLTQSRQDVAEGHPTLPLDAEERLKPLWKQWDTPRVTLDRVTGASLLYHIGRVTPVTQVGFWFALQGEAALLEITTEALTILADSGLGGLRSIGHGAFEWRMTNTSLPAVSGSAYAVTLSRYAPRDANEAAQTLRQPHSAYRLTNVGGWCVDDSQHGWRRRAVRMVAEGSVIGADAVGQLVDVTPNKPKNWQDDITPWSFSSSRRVYRWGYAFPIEIAPAALPEEVNYD